MKTICPYCRQSYEIDDEFNLQEGVCENCGKHFIIQKQEPTITSVISVAPSVIDFISVSGDLTSMMENVSPKHSTAPVESPDEELFILTEGQGKNALLVHPQYIILYQKYQTVEERNFPVPMTNIFSVQLYEPEEGAGRLTLSYHDNEDVTSKRGLFRAVSTIYFHQDQQTSNCAKQIADYIQLHLPQRKPEPVSLKPNSHDCNASEHEPPKHKAVENDTSPASHSAPSHGVIRHWGCSGIFVFVAGIIMFIIWMCNEEKSDSRIVIWGAMGLIACLYVWFLHIFNALRTQDITKLVLLIFLPIIGVILCEFLPDDPS